VFLVSVFVCFVVCVVIRVIRICVWYVCGFVCCVFVFGVCGLCLFLYVYSRRAQLKSNATYSKCPFIQNILSFAVW